MKNYFVNLGVLGRSIVRVGFSGHLRILPEALGAVEEALVRIFDEFEKKGACELVHSLGEGADRMAYREAKRRGWKRRVVFAGGLEFHREQCDSEESVEELEQMVSDADEIVELEAGEDEESLYVAGDRYIAGECEILVAMWDGKETEFAAGTWRVVDWHLEIGDVMHIFAPRGEMSAEGAGEVRFMTRRG